MLVLVGVPPATHVGGIMISQQNPTFLLLLCSSLVCRSLVMAVRWL
mgnify:CR=1 FL=1